MWEARIAREQQERAAKRAQTQFVKDWRKRNPGAAWGSEHWTCPLCGCIEQADHEAQNLDLFVKAHQGQHGQDWLDYLALARDAREPGTVGEWNDDR